MTATITTPDVNQELLQVLLTYKRELTDEEITTMLETMKPVVRRDGELYFIEPVDPRGVSFIWSPKATTMADGLTIIGQLYTLHTWGYYGLFKPSLAEVLSMVPPHMVTRIKAFETIGPHDADDLNRQWAAVDDNYHVAVTILYA